MAAGEKKRNNESFFHLPVAWWVVSSTPENHGVGGCSTFLSRSAVERLELGVFG
jgi:hypothetical protein